MDVRTVASCGRPAPEPWLPGLDRLVAELGTPALGESLFDAMHAVCGCAHLSVLAAPAGGPVSLLLAANEGPWPSARLAAEKYVAGYWRHDPANPVLAAGRAADLVLRTTPRDIGDSRYRRDCYRTYGLIDRVCLARSQGGRTIRINLYRARNRGRFSDDSLAAILDRSGLLLAFVQKHHDLVRQAPGAFDDRIRSRLEALALPPREREVCAGILAGRTSEAMALGMGVSINTVLTYRKRAYGRLRISSQNELARLVLS